MAGLMLSTQDIRDSDADYAIVDPKDAELDTPAYVHRRQGAKDSAVRR
jgi:hypothetical protein